MNTSASSPSQLAHHFDTIDQQRHAESLGMWVFLATEIMFFGAMFVAYAVYRSWYPAAFAEGGRHMDVLWGTVNTGLLLVSSFTVVLALHAAKSDNRRQTIIFLLVTILLGTAFLGVKGYEYWHKAHEQLVPGEHFHLEVIQIEGAEQRHVEIFFSLYFAMTGLHAAHMVIGIVMFSILTAMAWRNQFSASRYQPLELAGLYWHFVDIVWIFLFPLLYLVG